MAYTEENILVGAADIYVNSDTGADVKVPVAGDLRDPAAWEALAPEAPATGTWRHVGLTQGGVEFSYSPDFGEVEVDQWLDVAKMFKQRQTVTVNTTLVEATLENLLFAWGQNDTTLNDGEPVTPGADEVLKISAGNLGDKPQERSVAFVGNAPGEEDRVRTFHLYRALSVEATTFSLSRAEATTIPVSLRCLPTGGAEGNNYGTIVDSTVTPSTP